MAKISSAQKASTKRQLDPNKWRTFTDDSGKERTVIRGSKADIKYGGTAIEPAQEPAQEVGVVSSTQGQDYLKQIRELEAKFSNIKSLAEERQQQEQSQLNIPESERKRIGAEAPGISEGEMGLVSAKGGELKQTPSPIGTVPQGPEKTVVTIDPETEVTKTRTGETAEVDAQVQGDIEEGMLIAESTETGISETASPEQNKLEEERDSAIKEVEKLQKDLERLLRTDDELRGQVRAINSAWEVRKDEMRDITDRQVGRIKTLGMRSGARYTGGGGGIWGGLISEAERQGILALAELDAQQQTAVIEAKNAAREFNYAVYADLIDSANQLESSKAEELALLKKAQQEQDERIATEKKQLVVDAAVVDAIDQGFTTVGEVFAYINTGDAGVSLDEVNKAFKIANPSSDLADLDGDMADWEYLKSIGDPAGELTYTEFRRAVYNATHKATGGGGGKDEDDVLSLSELEKINDLYDVRLPYGTTKSEAAAMGIGTSEGGGEGGAEEDFVGATGYLRTSLTDDELSDIARSQGFADFWDLAPTEVNKFFKSEEQRNTIIALSELFQAYPDKKETIIEQLEDGKNLMDVTSSVVE